MDVLERDGVTASEGITETGADRTSAVETSIAIKGLFFIFLTPCLQACHLLTYIRNYDIILSKFYYIFGNLSMYYPRVMKNE